MSDSQGKLYDVMVSYSQQSDIDFVFKIVTALEKRSWKLWVDRAKISRSSYSLTTLDLLLITCLCGPSLPCEAKVHTRTLDRKDFVRCFFSFLDSTSRMEDFSLLLREYLLLLLMLSRIRWLFRALRTKICR